MHAGPHGHLPTVWSCSLFPWPLVVVIIVELLRGWCNWSIHILLPVTCQKAQMLDLAASQRGLSLHLFCQLMPNASPQRFPVHLCCAQRTEMGDRGGCRDLATAKCFTEPSGRYRRNGRKSLSPHNRASLRNKLGIRVAGYLQMYTGDEGTWHDATYTAQRTHRMEGNGNLILASAFPQPSG